MKAPWTAKQVDALNAFQRRGQYHPFTCPGHDGGGDCDLVATRKGWICCHCDYTQDWAHDFMAAQAASFNPLDAGFSLCADPNEQPESEAPQFKPPFVFK